MNCLYCEKKPARTDGYCSNTCASLYGASEVFLIDEFEYYSNIKTFYDWMANHEERIAKLEEKK